MHRRSRDRHACLANGIQMNAKTSTNCCSAIAPHLQRYCSLPFLFLPMKQRHSILHPGAGSDRSCFPTGSTVKRANCEAHIIMKSGLLHIGAHLYMHFLTTTYLTLQNNTQCHSLSRLHNTQVPLTCTTSNSFRRTASWRCGSAMASRRGPPFCNCQRRAKQVQLSGEQNMKLEGFHRYPTL